MDEKQTGSVRVIAGPSFNAKLVRYTAFFSRFKGIVQQSNPNSRWRSW